MDFAGSDTVDTFFIGATQQVAGDYGHTDSGATNGGAGVGALDAYFEAGTGSLTVTTGPPTGGYADWAAINAPGQDSSQDFDGDGVENGVEYVLGGSKDTNDLDKLPTLAAGGADMVFEFVRDQDTVDGTTTVTIEVGTNLMTWPTTYTVGADTAGSTAGVIVVDNEDGTDTITLTVDKGLDDKKFARLSVTVEEVIVLD